MAFSVLVVDDSSVVRSRLTEMLSEIDGVTHVDDAPGAAEARLLLATTAPDVVVLDIRMPGGSGIDLLREIKSSGSRGFVIMLTNYPLAPYRSVCLRAGADVFLDKSTELEAAVDIVRRLAIGPGQPVKVRAASLARRES
ncbi:MAG: hypothetical protein A3I61_05090 [Acidobacteria bacterium RIFCSPLOWO2_02_FULL_68_18]|nr:MAG: hypothetical protein A3I61_05090 [Acidobacteria bacterium RIFCSPLOWO2_02_FULL_68_18]OFW51277.1 MAG: hypothetical protein A3G77_05475 [Acidobacteria bacterium RIFCSPLOWO2_12_FULL_68_19]